ncbi:hypothetical protein SM033_00264 [Vibrio phage vB_VpaM_sm033]|nr:hypothetical protein SM033_00264 [Vibrio phage vB_VpaM_sm033]
MRKFANGEEVQVFSETTGKWEDTFVMEYIGDCDVTVMPNMKKIFYTNCYKLDSSYHPIAKKHGQDYVLAEEQHIRRKPKHPTVVDFDEMMHKLKNPDLIEKPEGEMA